MRYRLDFEPPNDPEYFVRYGHEALRGFWGELITRGQRGAVASYDAFEVEYRHDRPLVGMLEWLAQVGAFSASSLVEALAAWESPERVRLSRGARRALRVIATLKTEAD